jgi:hypothetical protein
MARHSDEMSCTLAIAARLQADHPFSAGKGFCGKFV